MVRFIIKNKSFNEANEKTFTFQYGQIYYFRIKDIEL